MFKVIVERPRSGSRMRWSGRTRRFLNSEDAPSKIGMQRGHGTRKWLNEHLGPLRKFLGRRVGRPWDAVHGEICAVIDTRSTVKQHVLSHIGDFVAVKTKLVEGKLYEIGRYSAVYTPLGEARQQLYVDPRTGLLCRNYERILRRRQLREEARRKQAELEARRRVLSPSEQLHRVDGLWYHVRLGRLPEARRIVRFESGRRCEKLVYEKRWDVLRRADVSSKDWTAGLEQYGRRGLYAAAKRQLSRQELRRYGLR
jgi:hypothetical protein